MDGHGEAGGGHQQAAPDLGTLHVEETGRRGCAAWWAVRDHGKYVACLAFLGSILLQHT